MRCPRSFGKAGVAAVAALVSLAGGLARAHPLPHDHPGGHDRTADAVERIVDQGVFLPPQQCYSTSFDDYQPIGQGFTPALAGLDFVDFFIEEATVGPGPDASYRVRVHSGSITGPVLGTSNTVAVPDGTNTGGGDIYTTFTFPSIVPLTPGTTYYLELQQLNPTVRSFLVCGRLSDAYPGGTQIQGGVPVPGRDLNFRVGLLVPEPSSLGLLAGTALLLPRRRDRRL